MSGFFHVMGSLGGLLVFLPVGAVVAPLFAYVYSLTSGGSFSVRCAAKWSAAGFAGATLLMVLLLLINQLSK